MAGRRKLLWTFFLLNSSALLLVSSGRLIAGDADAQADGAVYWVVTGQLGAPTPPAGWLAALPQPGPIGTLYHPHPAEVGLWKEAPNGSYYEIHDPGNLLWMAPVALLALRVAPAIDWPGPEGATRFVLGLISLAHCLLAAVGSTLMLSAFLTVLSPRAAVAVALVFVAGTIYLPYTKLNLDVLGCAVACAGLLAALCQALERREIDGLLGAGLARPSAGSCCSGRRSPPSRCSGWSWCWRGLDPGSPPPAGRPSSRCTCRRSRSISLIMRYGWARRFGRLPCILPSPV